MERHILVTDDDPVIRELIVAVLTGQRYEVSTARNGLEALKMIASVQYDLVISDISMPVMGGIEFYKEIINRFPSMKDTVIFVTGNLDASNEMFIEEMGIQCILKPFKISELLRVVDCHLGFKTEK